MERREDGDGSLEVQLQKCFTVCATFRWRCLGVEDLYRSSEELVEEALHDQVNAAASRLIRNSD